VILSHGVAKRKEKQKHENIKYCNVRSLCILNYGKAELEIL